MNVFELRDRLVGDYASYTRSFIKIRDARISEHVDRALGEGAFWPEPLLQLNPTFLPGGTIDDLTAQRMLHPECARIFRIDKSDSVQNPAFIRFLERLGDERLRHFSTYDFLALDAICRDQPLTESMRARLPGLIEAGAIEVQGRGRGVRHHLSRAMYAAIGQKGVYTRRKGLDHETNKALLMKHLTGNADVGAPLREPCQVLPAQSTSSVQRLLGELRSEGRVILRGARRGARWYPVKGQNGGDN